MRLQRYLSLRIVLAAILGLAVVAALLGFNMPFTGQRANANGVMTLAPPPFVRVALAEDAAVASVISDEAGIAAYFQASAAVNLANVRNEFRTIETETATYLLGSVPVPNYDETHDVHAYVDTQGWVLVYYFKTSPVSKIFDWVDYNDSGPSVIPTKLENALSVLASAIGEPFAGGTFYDFRYPNATHLMLIAEESNDGDDSFQVNLPGSYAYFERSWASTWDNFDLDEHNIDGGPYNILTPSQLSPDQFHTLDFRSEDGGLALVYRVP